jgi:hypothetical protein
MEGVFTVSENEKATSRRALLAAAVGGAAAVAAQAALPLAAQAHDPDDVQLGVTNVETATTGLDASGTADLDAFSASASGTGSAVVAASADGAAVDASSTNAPSIQATKSAKETSAAAYITSGDTTNAVAVVDTTFTGAYAWTPTSGDTTVSGAGVWGDSEDIGVYGSGGFGILGYGFYGVVGQSSSTSGYGVYAAGASGTSRALYVNGKVGFKRSGKTTISAGHASKTVSLSGMTTSSLVFAQLVSNRSGRWVRAVVSASGKFTIYLNSSVTKSTSVIWWVIN